MMTGGRLEGTSSTGFIFGCFAVCNGTGAGQAAAAIVHEKRSIKTVRVLCATFSAEGKSGAIRTTGTSTLRPVDAMCENEKNS